MGGNSRALDAQGEIKLWRGKPAFAEKIHLSVISRQALSSEIKVLLECIDDYYVHSHGKHIWDPELLKGTMVFNGSSQLFMDESISDREFLAVKPTIGDFDITVPDHAKSNLWALLRDLEGTLLTENIIYVGSNKPTESSVGEQINSVFEHVPTKTLFQIDWEFVEYTAAWAGLSVPTPWSKFSKSANWKDMQAGIKGVFHKYLLRSIARSKETVENISVLTPSSGTGNMTQVQQLQNSISQENDTKKIKQLTVELNKLVPKLSKPFLDKPNVNRYAFSILYGIRDKIDFLTNEAGEELLVVHPSGEIRRAVKLKAVEESQYVSDPKEIFEILFDTAPTEIQLEEFGSFLGLIELIKEYQHNPTLIVDQFLDLLWGVPGNKIDLIEKPEDITSGGQALERELWELDKQIKTHALNLLCKELGISITGVEKIHDLYYGKDGEAYLRLRTGPTKSNE